MKKFLILISLFCLFGVGGTEDKHWGCATASAAEISKISGKQVYKTTLGTDNDEVIIGDSQSATFKPEICFYKWNKENSLTIKPSGQLALDLADITPTLTNGKLEIKKDKIGWYANPDPADENNFKFGLILYEKPSTTTWSFQLEGWEEFDFFYSGIWANFKEVQRGNEIWIENLDTPNTRIRRPYKVQGSYAIYHKIKKDCLVGQTNYKCGKVGQIYRPRFIDANGNFEWATLFIKDGIYSISVSQEFLDTAKYPIYTNDEWGYLDKGADEEGWSGRSWATKFTSVPEGTITELHLYIYNYYGGSSTEYGALFSDDAANSCPEAKQVSVGFAVGVGQNGFAVFDVVDTIISAGTYWLSLNLSTSDYATYSDSETGYSSLYRSQTGDFPATWSHTGNTAEANKRYSFHATYTAAGGGAASTGSVMIIE